jgi:hypothetical protein
VKPPPENYHGTFPIQSQISWLERHIEDMGGVYKQLLDSRAIERGKAVYDYTAMNHILTTLKAIQP